MADNIVLIGFMGSGKTTIGLKLSYKLKKTFCDTDKMIEARERRTISEIFEQSGEDFFREKETLLLKEILCEDYAESRIFAVGGGTPLRAENRNLLKKLGTVVFLKVGPDTVYERLKEDRTRPLLQQGDALERIKMLLEQRAEVYEETADIIISCDTFSMDEVVRKIIDHIKKC